MKTPPKKLGQPPLLFKAEYKQMDVKIRELVRSLNKNRIITIGSCEGHIERGPTSCPYVFIDTERTEPSAIAWLTGRLSHFNFPRSGTFLVWTLYPSWILVYGESRFGTYLQPLRAGESTGVLSFNGMQKGIKELVEFLND